MGLLRQEYWSGLPFSSPGDLPNPGMEPRFPALTGGFFTTELPGKPNVPPFPIHVKIITPKVTVLGGGTLGGIRPHPHEWDWCSNKEAPQSSQGLPCWPRQWRIYLWSRRPGFIPWVGKILWRKKLQPTSVFLPGELHGQRSLAGCSPWGRKELDTTEQLTLSRLFHRAPKPHPPRKDVMRSWQPTTRTWLCCCPDLGLLAPRTVSNKLLLFINPLNGVSQNEHKK